MSRINNAYVKAMVIRRRKPMKVVGEFCNIVEGPSIAMYLIEMKKCSFILVRREIEHHFFTIIIKRP